jgi:hypothetical protein
MPVDKFRFVSPGIFLNEIDQSQIPALPENVGPVIVGRTEKGPGMIPTKVRSFSEFVEIFGNPIAGLGGVSDVWREGNYSSPTYGAYAAQAYLRSGVGPVTFIRLVGTEHPDANAAGKAGWETQNAPDTALASNGGPFGLFIFPSGADGSTYDGTLAAVWYMDSGSVPVLSGTSPAGNQIEGVATLVKSDASGQFKVRVIQTPSTEIENVTFSLNESSENFIRKVFSTNPQLVTTLIEGTDNDKPYWLGETFERHLTVESLVPSSNDYYGAILPVVSGNADEGNHDKRMAYRDAHSGWFFGQNLSADTGSYSYGGMQKLFKFVGINGYGSWLQDNVKISIDNIRASANENVKFGTFDVVVRRADDSDLRPVVLERFSNCSLDKNSPNFVAAKIGDMQMEWDSTEKRYRDFGDFPNASRYIRVHMHSDYDTSAPNAALLPFGVYGPPRFPAATFTSASTAISPATAYIQGSGNVPTAHFVDGGKFVNADNEAFGTANIVFPAVGIRVTASTEAADSSDGADPTSNAYFGLQTGKNVSSNVTDPGYADYLRAFGSEVISDAQWVDDFGKASLPSTLDHQWIFSLDEIIVTTGSNFTSSAPSNNITQAVWSSGSMAAGTSWTASSSLGTARFKNVLDSRINRFTSPMFGGFDGLDITQRDPFRNSLIDTNPTEQNSYVYYTLRRAVDTVADPEVAEMNLLSIPGITDDRVTDHIIQTAEARGDTLAVIDVEGGFTPRHESANSRSDRKGNLNTVLTNIKARNLNNSYGAAYYPWVKVRDTINGVLLDVPPSVVALGVLASTERSADVWFAPAGFNRGGLSNGAGGLPVVGVETKLTSRNRDDLYDVNINPIASFPAEGIVVFGQKTLQATPSALDRINVRRLMIFVKRGISRISAGTLFQPNVQATWNDFKSRATKFLDSVKVNFGIDDYRVVLDETTTTPDLVDRNILYAKIFIKPTRAIEFIAIDFIITRSGASFED